MTLNHYLDVSLPLLQRCKVFLVAEDDKNVAVDFRDRVVSDFVELERNAQEAQLDPKLVVQLKYLLSTFIDEIVMHSVWSQRITWMGRSLQLQFFGEHLGGEGFFDSLNQIRQSGQSHIDLLEVCYWCLQFGFQGKYRFQDQSHLLNLQASVLNQLKTARGQIEKPIAPAGLPSIHQVKQNSRNIPFWVIGIVTMAVIYFIYVAYSMAIDAQTKIALREIQHAFSTLQEHA